MYGVLEVYLHPLNECVWIASRPTAVSSVEGTAVDYSWNVLTHGDAREGKWRGHFRMEWVASTLHTTSEHGVSSITTADAHTSADLNGLVRFAERRNLVSARVPSHFNWPLPTGQEAGWATERIWTQQKTRRVYAPAWNRVCIMTEQSGLASKNSDQLTWTVEPLSSLSQRDRRSKCIYDGRPLRRYPMLQVRVSPQGIIIFES